MHGSISETWDKIITPLEQHVKENYTGKYVLIRTYASGVHFGKLKLYEPENSHCVLEDSRRLYSWVDRFTLTEVAQQGVTERALMSIPIAQIMIGDVIEILSVSEEAEDSLKNTKACS